MKKTLLAAIVVLSLALSAVGGTFAGFSDTERSLDNIFEVSDMDLKVAAAEVVEDEWVGDDFRDDLPWGDGLVPLFDIDDAQICQTYSANRLLWNAGEVDSVASLLLRLTDDTASIADTTDIEVWYDADGNEEIDPGETTVGKLASLDCQPFVLGPLPGCETRQLTLSIHPKDNPSEPVVVFSLAFTAEFQQVQVGHSFSDTETTWGSLGKYGEGCTPGFWQGAIGTSDKGRWMWDEANDPDWTAAGGSGTNPYIHTTLFNDFFTSHPDLDGLTMMDIVGTGGGPDPVRKAARSLVAAYLNTSFGMNYPLNTTELHNLWNDAIIHGTFLDLHIMLDDYNNLGCSL